MGDSEPPILYPIPTSALSFLHQDVNNDVFGCETFRHIGLDSLQQGIYRGVHLPGLKQKRLSSQP